MTNIEWTRGDDGSPGKTWNPVRGCSRVSPGCDNCYAMGQAHRFSGEGGPYQGLTTIRRGKVDWTGSARFVPEMLEQPLRWKKPRRIFVNSMSDLFHESLSNEEIAAVFGVMAACPQHTFQVLTKRPERMLKWFEWVAREFENLADDVGEPIPSTSSHEASACVMLASRHINPLFPVDHPLFTASTRRAMKFMSTVERAPWPIPNVWLGVSVENQKTADERIPLLLQCPAAVRFISAEPLLGPVDLAYTCFNGADSFGTLPGLDWVIVGGESGHGARACDVEWIRRIISDCKKAKVPVFCKQLGAKPYDSKEPLWEDGRVVGTRNAVLPLKHKKGADMSEWPADLRVREFPEATP